MNVYRVEQYCTVPSFKRGRKGEEERKKEINRSKKGGSKSRRVKRKD